MLVLLKRLFSLQIEYGWNINIKASVLSIAFVVAACSVGIL